MQVLVSKQKNLENERHISTSKKVVSPNHQEYFFPENPLESTSEILNYLLSDKNQIEWGRFKVVQLSDSDQADGKNPKFLNPKTLVPCKSKDLFGNERYVFLDRICDGRSDCPGNEDESRMQIPFTVSAQSDTRSRTRIDGEGSGVVCIRAPPNKPVGENSAPIRCCHKLSYNNEIYEILVDHEFDKDTTTEEKYLLNDSRAWRNKLDSDKIIMKWHNGAWIHSITGHPDDGVSVAYDAYSTSEFSDCPPTDNSWKFVEQKMTIPVFCVSSGRYFARTANQCDNRSNDGVFEGLSRGIRGLKTTSINREEGYRGDTTQYWQGGYEGAYPDYIPFIHKLVQHDKSGETVYTGPEYKGLPGRCPNHSTCTELMDMIIPFDSPYERRWGAEGDQVYNDWNPAWGNSVQLGSEFEKSRKKFHIYNFPKKYFEIF